MTDLRGVDLNTFRFDFDLTFAVLLMHPDGTVYHRYGGRDAGDADAALNMPSLLRLLRDGLETHREYLQHPAPPSPGGTLDELPAWRTSLRRSRVQGCYHCHFVFEAERLQAIADGTWTRDAVWRWPGPDRVGLALAAEEQGRVEAVAPGSPAAAAGVEPGDRLVRLGSQRILSRADVSAVLEGAETGATALPVTLLRSGVERSTRLELPAGWKAGRPLDVAWRPSLWALTPRPGFGGELLSPSAKEAQGLSPDAFALKVGYLTTYARDPRPFPPARTMDGSAPYGRAAEAAGLRPGDVVLAVNGRRFASAHHLHVWWRLTRTPGEAVTLDVLRDGDRLTLEVTVPR